MPLRSDCDLPGDSANCTRRFIALSPIEFVQGLIVSLAACIRGVVPLTTSAMNWMLSESLIDQDYISISMYIYIDIL